MGNHYFFTGYPGFIASSLIRQMIRESYEIDHITLLVHPSLVLKAKKEVEALSIKEGISADKFSILAGDITRQNLNLQDSETEMLKTSVTHVFHLAAIYDLAVPKDIAYSVNVTGTDHVNQWVRQLSSLERYVYFSTAYVSGTREGVILESELEMNQSFKNHYEHTKYEAEVLVRALMDEVPTTIIRPGVVKGHSITGETTKFDGPYFVLNFFDRLRFLPFIPYLGDGSAKVNFVPVDYIFDATLYLSHHEIGAGKTYHLTDPNPSTAREVYKMLMENFLEKKPAGTLPLSIAKSALSVSHLRKWLGVEKEALDYFTCLAHYDCSRAQKDLEGSGITCPSFKETVGSMVAYYKQHKNDRDKHIKIS